MAGCSDLPDKLLRRKTVDANLMGTRLKRCLSTLDLTLLGIGGMIGAGVYVLTGTVAKNIAGPAVVVSFLIAGAASFLAALNFAELGTKVPKAGSAYIYTYVTLGEFIAFMIGWNMTLDYLAGGAAIARAWSGYFDQLIGFRIRNFTIEYIAVKTLEFPLAEFPDLFALLLIILITVCVSLGAAVSSKFNSLFASLNLCVLLFVICVGLYFADISNWKDYGGFAPGGFSGIFRGAAVCFFAYVGFDVIASSAEEIENPGLSIPVATVVSLVVTLVANVGMSVTLTLMIPYTAIEPEAAFPDAFFQNGLPWAQYIVGVGALFGMTTTLLGTMFTLPRILFAMASDGLLFDVFAKIHPNTKVPVVGTIVSGALAGFLAVLFSLEALVEFLSIGTLTSYTMVAINLLILRYRPRSETQENQINCDEGSDESDENVPLCAKEEQLHKSSDIGSLKTHFRFLHFLTKFKPGSVPAFNIVIMTLFMFALAAVITYGAGSLKSVEAWAIICTVVFGLVVLLSFSGICIHNHDNDIPTFKVPMVPYLPVLSIFINVYLTVQLSYVTWTRFGVWIALGMIVYFSYSIRHSKEAHKYEEDDSIKPIMQNQNGSDDGILKSETDSFLDKDEGD